MRGVWACLLVGCTAGPVDEKGAVVDDGPVHPLAEAGSAAWAQRVLVEGAPGERVEGVALAVGRKTNGAVVTFIDAAAVRRSVRIGDDLSVVPLDHVVSEVSRGSVSEIGPDGHSRIAVKAVGKGSELAIDDTVRGEGRVLIRDNQRVLRHPSFATDSSAVYFDEGGELGGIWRIALGDDAVTRVVPSKAAATPLAFKSAEGEGVIWIEEEPGQPSRVVLSRPEPEPRVPIGQVAATIPASLWPSVLDGAGVRLRVQGCEAEAPLRVTATERGVIVQPVSPMVLDLARSATGRVVLGAAMPGGVMRDAVAFVAERGGWTVSPMTGVTLPDATWIGGPEAEQLGVVSSCVPPLGEDIWLQVPMWVGEARAKLMAVASNEREIVGYGTRGAGAAPFVVYAGWDGRQARVQSTAKVVGVDPRTATAKSGAIELAIEGGAVVWKNGGEGVLVPAAADRKPIAVALSPSGDTLFVSDAGASPGVDRIDVRSGARARVAAMAPSNLTALVVEGAPMIAWTETWGDRPAIIAARAMDPGERAAWMLGPASGVGLVPSWQPAQVDDGALARCTGELDVKAAREGDTLRLTVGARVEVVHAVVEDMDGAVRVLGAGPAGAPRVLLEIAPDRGLPPAGRAMGVRMFDRMGGFERWPESVGWYPAEAATTLPQGGACRLFR